MIEITTLTKSGVPLKSRINIMLDGTLHSDGAACVVSAGSARPPRSDARAVFAAHIANLASNEAVALGALRPDPAEPTRAPPGRRRLGAASGLPRAVAGRAHFAPRATAPLQAVRAAEASEQIDFADFLFRRVAELQAGR